MNLSELWKELTQDQKKRVIEFACTCGLAFNGYSAFCEHRTVEGAIFHRECIRLGLPLIVFKV